MGSISPSYPPVYPPFPNTGSLNNFKLVHLTPAIGSEFRDVDVTQWLREPNSDDMLRDLSLLRMQLPYFVPDTDTDTDTDQP